MADSAQEGRFHLRGGLPSRRARLWSAMRSPCLTHSSANAASATCQAKLVKCHHSRCMPPHTDLP